MVAERLPRRAPRAQRRERRLRPRQQPGACGSRGDAGSSSSTATRVLVDDSVARLLRAVQGQNRGWASRTASSSSPTAGCSTRPTASRACGSRCSRTSGSTSCCPRRGSGEMLLSGYWDYGSERDVDWVAGAFMLMPRARCSSRRAASTRASSCTARTWSGATGSATHGWRIRYYPDATIKHFDHVELRASAGVTSAIAICLRRQRDIYRERHGAASTIGLMTAARDRRLTANRLLLRPGRPSGRAPRPTRPSAVRGPVASRPAVALAYRR